MNGLGLVCWVELVQQPDVSGFEPDLLRNVQGIAEHNDCILLGQLHHWVVGFRPLDSEAQGELGLAIAGGAGGAQDHDPVLCEQRLGEELREVVSLSREGDLLQPRAQLLAQVDRLLQRDDGHAGLEGVKAEAVGPVLQLAHLHDGLVDAHEGLVELRALLEHLREDPALSLIHI